MRLHEEFGLSVSDDTVYHALKEADFSHVSARPRAYNQAPEAIDTFKKLSRAWNVLIDWPWKITSAASREWAVIGQSI